MDSKTLTGDPGHVNSELESKPALLSQRRLSVLFVTACGEAGVPDYILFFSEGLSKLGVRVTVIGPSGSRFAQDISRLPDVEFIGLPLSKKPSPIRDLYCCFRQWRVMRNGAFDIVHSNSTKAAFLTALSRIGVPKTKFVYSPHCTSANLMKTNRFARFYFALERWGSRRHDLLISGCQSECSELLAARMSRNARAVHVYYGVDTDDRRERSGAYRRSIGIADDQTLLGTVARLVPQKGVDYLLDCFTAVADKLPDVHLAIAGDGPLENEFKTLVRERGIEDRVHFLGYVKDCNSFLADIDLFVLSSRWDALPLAMLRSGVVGTPVVVSNVGGVSEIIDDSTGWTVPIGDVERLTVAVLEALSDMQEAKRRAERLRERVVEKCNLTDATRRMFEVYSREVGS